MSKELLKEWTDGDLQCCIEKESDTCFVYAEVRYLAPNEYCFVVESVDVSDYSPEQLKEIVTSWYPGGVSEIKDTYKAKANQIIAECIFEETADSECFYTSSIYKTEDEAAHALEKYVNGYMSI